MLRTFVRNNFSTLTGPARTLGVLHFLDSMGNGLFLSGSAVYFVLVAHLPVATVGLGLSLAGFSGFVSSVLFGRMTDRTGARRLLAVLLFTLGGAYALYPLVDSAALFFPLVIVIGALEFGCGPAFGALIMDLVPETDRVTARAALRSLFNVGFTIGTLAAALLIGLGGTALQMLPLGNGLTFLLAAALVLALPATLVKPGGAGRARFRALRDRPFLAVVGASSLLALHSAVLLVGIPLWIVQNTDLPHGIVPLIMGVNTVLVVLFQVAASRGSDTLDGAVTAARRAGLVSAVACAVLSLGGVWGNAATGALVVCAVLLLTLAELWQSASGFGLGFGLAPEKARGEYLGAFHLHMVIQATVGPAAVSLLVVGHAALGWLAVGLIFLVGVAAIGPSVARARQGVEADTPDESGADAPAA